MRRILDALSDDVLIMMTEDLMRGQFDEDMYIVTPSIKDRITLYKYMKALANVEIKRNKLELFSRIEFEKENYINITIGSYIINHYEEAMVKHDKAAKAKYIEMFKKEIERLNAIAKIKDGYKSDMTRSSAEAILAEYLGAEEASKEHILEAYPTAKILQFRKPNQNDGSRPSL